MAGNRDSRAASSSGQGYYDRSRAADAVARDHDVPSVAIVLGSGLGDFAGHARRRRVDAVRASCRTGPRRASSGTKAGSSSARVKGRTDRGAGRPLSRVRRPRPADGHLCRAGARRARRQDADPHERRRRHQHGLRAGRADGHRRSHQPDRHESARRRERRPVRPALSRHDRGLLARLRRDRRRGGRRRSACRWRTASTRRCWARATRRRPRSGICARSAPTPSACPRRRRSHRRAAHGDRGARHLLHHATWRRACCRSRSITTR